MSQKTSSKNYFFFGAVRVKEADGPEGGRFWGFGGFLCLGEGFWEGKFALYFLKVEARPGEHDGSIKTPIKPH